MDLFTFLSDRATIGECLFVAFVLSIIVAGAVEALVNRGRHA